MELIAAVLLAGPLGYFAADRSQGLKRYLIAWIVIFPIQTYVVFELSDDGNDIMYWVVNVAILALGIGFNHLGARLRERRLQPAS